ncbi:hypothetical protein BDL97_07G073500 [Sphagnum fallax]|nr:hypothetical protein BDL97_07G073500 [Sphagnum fallax]
METKVDGEVQSKDLAFATSIPSRAAHFSFRISKLFLFQNFKALSLSEFQSSFCSKRVRGGGGGSGDHNAQEFLEEVCLDCRVRSHHIFLDGCGCAQVERGDNCWLEGG